MFARYLKNLTRALPLALAFGLNMLSYRQIQLATPPIVNQTRIKFISDIGEYIQSQSEQQKQFDKILIICELKGQQFIDEQLIALAKQFLNQAQYNNIDTKFQFLFLKALPTSEEQYQSFFIIYSSKGEKFISLEPYLNYNRKKPYIKVSNKHLMKRLAQTIKGPRQLSLRNLAEQLSTVKDSSNYYALVVIPEQGSNKINTEMNKFMANHQIKAKFCSKFIVKDQQSKTILGLSNKDPGIYLLTSVNANLELSDSQKQGIFKIGEKPFVILNPNENIQDKFTFPPIQPQIPAQTIVLNVYINKNHNTGEIQQKLLAQLNKPQYKHLPKGIFYTSDVQYASLALQMNQYSKVSLTAFDPKTPLPASKVKQILGNTFQWVFPIKSASQISSTAIQEWIKQSTSEDKTKYQNYKSEPASNGWATPITGLEYKQKRDQPNDKIIYHYSHHCHGCKKFGPKFEQFALRSKNSQKLKFYKINNDYNKAQGVRNFNTTPVFAYYKENCSVPFVYKMPIFTEQLFGSFLDITGNIKLMNYSLLVKALKDREEAKQLIKPLLEKVIA